MESSDATPQFLRNKGYCPICMRNSVFLAPNAWLRDGYLCVQCASLPRQRAIVQVLNYVAPSWRGWTIHESSPALHFFAEQCKKYSFSFYFEGVGPGEFKEDLRCENLECLTFAPNTFDLFITQDVMEHVFDPARACAEVMRVLKPGGLHLFTTPKHKHLLKSRRRAEIIDGKVNHLLPPEYHGNPIGDGTSLVTWDFGADFDDLIEEWSGYKVSVFVIRDRNLGIDGEYLEVFVVRRDSINQSVVDPPETSEGRCADMRADVRLVLSSGLFHSKFYGSDLLSETSGAEHGVKHYLAIGSRLGYDPHPVFDTSFYAAAYIPAGIETNPLVHYLTVGATENYWPNPLFDPLYYRSTCAHAIPAGVSPLEDYVKGRGPSRVATHPLFDVDYYLQQAPEAADSEFTILGHYLANWVRDRVSPQPLFDIEYYLSQCPDLASSGLDPISHYLLIGHQCNYNPHPLFDTGFYYRRYPDVQAAGMNALVHYLSGGGSERRDPHPWFDSSYYCENNRDLVEARTNPLLHYVMHGARAGRHPHPMFRAEHWARLHDLDENSTAPLIHFSAEMARPDAHLLEALQLRDPVLGSLSRERVSGRPGVNLIGWPRLEIGFGEYLRETARGMDAVGLDFAIRDVSLMGASAPGDDSWSHRIVRECPYNTSLFVVNADNMLSTSGQLGFETLRDRFNIALWAWELADYPDVWRKEMTVLDEMWAFSVFNQECLALKAKVPVIYMPQPVTVSTDAGLTRADFGIPDNRFIFLFQFDFTGFIERKNPWASLAAFRKAFPQRNSGAVLVIKTNNSERYPERMRELLDAVGDDEDVVLVNGTFPREKVMSLMGLSDVFVSLHRAEGFGRSLAESMLLGKPVVATNYSGNTEFMNQQNSCLVNYTLVPVNEGQYPFHEGQVWAEADIEHAAWHMRRLFQNRQYRQFVGQAGRKTIEERYSPLVIGRRYLRRLRLLGLVPDGAH